MRHPDKAPATPSLDAALEKKPEVYTPSYFTKSAEVMGGYDINKNGRLDKSELPAIVEAFSVVYISDFLKNKMTCDAINGQHPAVMGLYMKNAPARMKNELLEVLQSLDGRLAFPNGMAEVTLDDVKPLTNRVVQHIGDCSSNKIGR